MSHNSWGAERTVGININAENVRVIEIAEIAKPYEDFNTIGYVFSSEHADMIIKAVNSHQAMKKALEDIVKLCNTPPSCRPIAIDAVIERLASQALTLANGGTSE